MIKTREVIFTLFTIFMVSMSMLTVQVQAKTIGEFGVKIDNNVDSSNYADSVNSEDTIPSNQIYRCWNHNLTHIMIDSIPMNYVIQLKGFTMPVKTRMVTSNYGYRPRFKRYHKGVDLKASMGDTIYASFSGKVRIVKYDKNGYGNYVVIRHNNGMETIYGHLSKQLVSINENVVGGQAIGLAGSTGRSTGPHLHFETRFCGRAINPSELVSFEEGKIKMDNYKFVG